MSSNETVSRQASRTTQRDIRQVHAIWDAQAVSELCDLHDDLFNAAPASIVEFFAKWRQVAKFEAELADPAAGIIEPADVITAMLDELQVLPGR
jgi:hypothetical protein